MSAYVVFFQFLLDLYFGVMRSTVHRAMSRSCWMWSARGVPSLCRYHHRWQRSNITAETAKAANHFCRRNTARCESATEIRAVLAVQHHHRRYVSVGGAGCYGIALHVLLPRRQSQRMAHGEETAGAGKSTDRPTKTQKASSHIEHAIAVVKFYIVIIYVVTLGKKLLQFGRIFEFDRDKTKEFQVMFQVTFPRCDLFTMLEVRFVLIPKLSKSVVSRSCFKLYINIFIPCTRTSVYTNYFIKKYLFYIIVYLIVFLLLAYAG